MSDGIQYRDSSKTRRNDPCPCGSGDKFKRCCGHSSAKPSNAGGRKWSHATEGEFRRRCRELDAECSGRARALVAILEEVLPPEPGTGGSTRAELAAASVRKRRRAQGRSRKHQGHPSRLSRSEKRAAFMDPDGYLSKGAAELEKGTQEMNRLMRKLRREGQYDGPVALGLAAAALYIAPEVAAEMGLEGQEHEAALTEWLVGHWGQFIHDTALDPAGYLTWRAKAGGARA